jgi:pimeloyl-ACP methyl ester carboxylesterase
MIDHHMYIDVMINTANGTATSRDGTTIGYRQFGHGPGVVVLHGAMSSGANHVQLAEALADAFTVVVPDRRGRGSSGPAGDRYGLAREVEDLEAVLAETGAHDVFGVSSGGIICLEAARTLPAVRRAAIFEPPLGFTRAEAAAVLARFDGQMARGRVATALITAMKAAQMGPPFLRFVPTAPLALLSRLAMRAEDRRPPAGYVPMRALAPTLHGDLALVAEMSERLETFADVQAEVLLLSGGKSPAALREPVGELEGIVPGARRVELPGVDHAACWNADRGGRPEPVARELRRFFARV